MRVHTVICVIAVTVVPSVVGVEPLENRFYLSTSIKKQTNSKTLCADLGSSNLATVF